MERPRQRRKRRLCLPGQATQHGTGHPRGARRGDGKSVAGLRNCGSECSWLYGWSAELKLTAGSPRPTHATHRARLVTTDPCWRAASRTQFGAPPVFMSGSPLPRSTVLLAHRLPEPGSTSPATDPLLRVRFERSPRRRFGIHRPGAANRPRERRARADRARKRSSPAVKPPVRQHHRRSRTVPASTTRRVRRQPGRVRAPRSRR